MATILNFVNTEGIPCIQSTGVSLSATAAVFSFAPSVSRRFRNGGGIFVRIRPQDTFTAPTTAVPIQFTTIGVENSTITLKGRNGADVTTADWTGTGIYLVFFDPVNNELSLVTSV